MIRMSRTTRCVAQLVFGLIVVFAVGCCGSGPSHKCDFTPPDTPGFDGGTDGPMLCGTAVCEGNTVCCYKKAPPLAICISPLDYQKLGCEKMDLPCFTSSDCPGGLNCCLMFSVDGSGSGTVTCRQQLMCPGDGAPTFIACGTNLDCPPTRSNCTFLTSTPKGDFSICE